MTEPSPTQRPMRADARRNYERLVAVARDAFAEHGVDTSLDDIAKRAGVGSGTLYRHFPTREALLEAVYLQRVEALCARVPDLLAAHPPGDALARWLREIVAHISALRGLAAVLLSASADHGQTMARWHNQLRSAGAELLVDAQLAGAVRPDLAITDLLKLANAVALATETALDRESEADRLLALVTDGIWSA